MGVDEAPGSMHTEGSARLAQAGHLASSAAASCAAASSAAAPFAAASFAAASSLDVLHVFRRRRSDSSFVYLAKNGKNADTNTNMESAASAAAASGHRLPALAAGQLLPKLIWSWRGNLPAKRKQEEYVVVAGRL